MDAFPRRGFGSRSSADDLYDRHDSRPPETKFTLQAHHFDKLEKAFDFPTWERRIKSAMQSVGYGDQLIGFGPLKSSTQEQILNFLVQTVRDPGGFDKLTTILEKEVKDNISRRGS